MQFSLTLGVSMKSPSNVCRRALLQIHKVRDNQKIVNTCRLAITHGLEYVWIDTCCIDKTSSAELSEAINSMYTWYENAERCYVYFSDLEPAVRGIEEDIEPAAEGKPALQPAKESDCREILECRWWTRGWTLQELIAPLEVEFYDKLWKYRGNKHDHRDAISHTVQISADVLAKTVHLNKFSVASRMSWAAKRHTTRLEDQAYCLLGVFGVNMPLIYGEGARAFQRLQEEIIRTTNDLTIFACNYNEENPSALFANSPHAFAGLHYVTRSDRGAIEFAMTNRGLRIYDKGCLSVSYPYNHEAKPRTGFHCLEVGYKICVPLLLTEANTFIRDPRWQSMYGDSKRIEGLDKTHYATLFTYLQSSVIRGTRAAHLSNYYINSNPTPDYISRLAGLDSPPGWLRVNWPEELRLLDAVPERTFDHNRRAFYCEWPFSGMEELLGLEFGPVKRDSAHRVLAGRTETISWRVVILINQLLRPPLCLLHLQNDYSSDTPSQAWRTLSRSRYRVSSLTLPEVSDVIPEIELPRATSSRVHVDDGIITATTWKYTNATADWAGVDIKMSHVDPQISIPR